MENNKTNHFVNSDGSEFKIESLNPNAIYVVGGGPGGIPTHYKTLRELWDLHSSLTTSYIMVKNLKGKSVKIEGLRPGDDDGGCMATGTDEALYGVDHDGSFWFKSPQCKLDQWIFSYSYELKFYVRDLKNTTQVFRGIDEQNGRYKIISSSGSHVWVSSDSYEKIVSP